MTTTTTTDPRTEDVARAADDVDHIYCGDCSTTDMPMMCGARSEGPDCGDGCGHPTCPMCEIEWEGHRCLNR